MSTQPLGLDPIKNQCYLIRKHFLVGRHASPSSVTLELSVAVQRWLLGFDSEPLGTLYWEEGKMLFYELRTLEIHISC